MTERVRGRLGTRLAVALPVAVPAAVLAGLTAVAVESEWGPLRHLDQHTASSLHARATGHPALIRALIWTSDVGGPTTFRVLVGILVVFLWVRGARRLALWAGSAMIAAAVLDIGLKAAVNRARPLLPHPFAHAPGASFPSGHALTSAVGCGIFVLALLPVLGPTGRRVLWAGALIVVAAIGYSRVALGVHWVSDVLAGWLLAVALLAASASAFETWRAEHGLRPTRPAAEGVDPEETTEALVAGDEERDGHDRGRDTRPD